VEFWTKTADSFIFFGCSYKTSDFMVDNLQIGVEEPIVEQQATVLNSIKIDNGPEVVGFGPNSETNGRLCRTSASRFSSSIIRLIIGKYNPIESGAGDSRATLEWDITSRYSDTIGLGTEYDLEGDSSYSLFESKDTTL
jgi:hypothetical protein